MNIYIYRDREGEKKVRKYGRFPILRPALEVPEAGRNGRVATALYTR